MIIRCCDVETTGKEATDEVVEIGWHEIRGGTLYSTAAPSTRPERAPS
ncbi:DNA polymerase III epsilon subunit-like protein [Bradyrhizobium japonicum]